MLKFTASFFALASIVLIALPLLAAAPAKKTPTPLQKAVATLSFSKLDKNADGFISVDEWAPGTKPSFKECDANRDQKVSKQEWLDQLPVAPSQYLR